MTPDKRHVYALNPLGQIVGYYRTSGSKTLSGELQILVERLKLELLTRTCSESPDCGPIGSYTAPSTSGQRRQGAVRLLSNRAVDLQGLCCRYRGPFSSG